MTKRKQTLFPKHLKILERMGENIKLARKRRKLTTVQVSERAMSDTALEAAIDALGETVNAEKLANPTMPETGK